MAQLPRSGKVVTGIVRFSYVTVFAPKSRDKDGTGVKKYSISLIISKNSKEGKKTLATIRPIIDDLAEQVKASNGGKLPKKFLLPLHDGDEDKEDDEAYAESFYLSANSTNKPGIVGPDLQPIMDASEFYSGCYGRASITFYVYDKDGNRGIACGLSNLMKTDDGESLGGSSSSAEADFKDFSIED